MSSHYPAEQDGPCFDGLSALFINRTLKRSPERSHTQRLIDISRGIKRDERPLQLAALGVRDPAAGRCRLGR